MFKPFKGTCNECLQPKMIVVRAGYCNVCNERRKKEKKNNTPRIDKGYAKPEKNKPSGELNLFLSLWQKALDKSGDESPKCRCCGEHLGFQFSVAFFSHLLSKGFYPAYRLLEENIWIICFDCHYLWSSGSRNDPRFTEKNIEYERLKRKYINEVGR